ncbi:hypothetical protein G7K_4411-t1 [Saitoella complicata NRRL Y-17804]|uniref:Raptor N-terminal CASPase-like domain-containing protein n=2 Tax=Saitoella complicata (strain BCRC 22490 / CBS 7301 / JCM 7358 / NBRC 10748 / NRRL Y-17804) TaxID=698492 RepID=A0A0E9NKP5_SAICN|nr:hypothetical protein G7K_4411-t1 [Saitoella complicata NRRL Y-17804]
MAGPNGTSAPKFTLADDDGSDTEQIPAPQSPHPHATRLRESQAQAENGYFAPRSPILSTKSPRNPAGVNGDPAPVTSDYEPTTPTKNGAASARRRSDASIAQNAIQKYGTMDSSGSAIPDINESEIKLTGMRHGFQEDYDSDEYLGMLEQVFYMYYADKRHDTSGNPRISTSSVLQDWRMRERLKTVSAALVVCLNIGVDPPDIVKTSPCAKLECWIDPFSLPASKSLEAIGKNLQQQYETLSMRTRYKQYLDPSVEETKKFCCALRRNAKEERILFHYNGHGVPKPTTSGEIWVFNKNYTQYIPVSLYDLQSWLGAPCLYVWDCSAAGNIVQNFMRFVDQRENEYKNASSNGATTNGDGNGGEEQPSEPVSPQSFRDCIQLAACGPNEVLPMNPDLPADLFTCCLTSPIEIAVRWFVLQNPLPSNLSIDMVMNIPGRLQDRRTPLGELNWIFTAITDTIAWNVLPRPLFKRLFRQDLMVAALFRNFLLAERIMRVHQCHPVSYPAIPATHNHPMWDSWDLAVDTCLAQLPHLIAAEHGGPAYEYKHSSFFTEQLTAFEVWLAQGAVYKKVPDQLPIVLQVLLSQVHRLRALILLSKFLDLGPWAVNQALSIGIFPYVLKLLQSPAPELKPVLVFIWARILAVDGSCQADLLKDTGYTYFVQILTPNTAQLPVANVSEHRAMCAFILSVFCRDFKQGQVACMQPGVLSACLSHLGDEDPLLRQWATLCVAQLWKDLAEAKWMGIRDGAHERLCELLTDPVPEVRAAALVALGNFLGLPDKSEQAVAVENYIAIAALGLTADGSGMVRKELVVFLSIFISLNAKKFMVTALGHFEEKLASSEGRLATSTDVASHLSRATPYDAVWQALLILSVDPFSEVAVLAVGVVDAVHAELLKGPLGEVASNIIKAASQTSKPAFDGSLSRTSTSRDGSEHPSQAPDSPARPGSSRLTRTLTRSASIAVSLKNLALGHHEEPAPAPEPNRPPPEDEAFVPSTPQPSLKVPLPKSFKELKGSKSPPQELPLKSSFFQWSCEYFMEPQMKPQETDEPGSMEYNQRLWRRNRNERIIFETQPQKEIAGASAWNLHAGYFNNETQPMRLLFHQFEPHLVAADDRDGISVWDHNTGTRLNRFSNGNPMGSRITEVKFINEDDVALLMTGSGEGIIRLYRNYESEESMELVSSWRALTDLLPSNRSSGLVAEWQQGRGTLLVGGDVKVIRVWDAPRETCLSDIPARSGSCITSLTSDQVAGNIFVAGFGDGAVRVYDRRLPPRDAMVKVWKDHKTWIANVHMQRGGNRELVSGSVSGDVKLWDIRLSKPVRTIQAHTGGLRTLAVHEHAPVFASGSTNHFIKVWNTSGPNLSTFRHYSGFLHQGRQTSSAVTSLAFHPHMMSLAVCGGGDHHINIYKVAA